MRGGILYTLVDTQRVLALDLSLSTKLHVMVNIQYLHSGHQLRFENVHRIVHVQYHMGGIATDTDKRISCPTYPLGYGWGVSTILLD